MRASATKNFDEVLGGRRSLARISDVFGKISPKHSTALVGTAPTMTGFFRGINADRPADVPDHIGTLIGAAVGGYVGGVSLKGSHPVRDGILGAISGASVGRNVPALFQDDVRKLALRNLVTTGSAVVMSRYMENSPILGFGIGWLAGGAVAYFGGLK
jgi:hypothetical protein